MFLETLRSPCICCLNKMAQAGVIVLAVFLIHTASGRQADGPNFEAGLPLRQSNEKSQPKLWPRGKVPYAISSTIVDDAKIRLLQEPMRDIESHTCIKFVNRRSESEYLNIQSDRAACSAQVGVQTGINQMNLADACYDYPTIALNLLYVLGLYNENTRSDRDQYVEINNENLRGLNQKKFEKAPHAQEVLNTPYDFRSLTHFPEQAFGIKKGTRDWTIRAKKSSTTQLGNNKLSSGDFAKLNALYCGGRSAVRLKRSIVTLKQKKKAADKGTRKPAIKTHLPDPVFPSRSSGKIASAVKS